MPSGVDAPPPGGPRHNTGHQGSPAGFFTAASAMQGAPPLLVTILERFLADRAGDAGG